MPLKQEYMIHLILKVEIFNQNMKWKALEYLVMLDNSEKLWHKYKTLFPLCEWNSGFQIRYDERIKKIEFTKVSYNFGLNLISEIKNENQSNNL